MDWDLDPLSTAHHEAGHYVAMQKYGALLTAIEFWRESSQWKGLSIGSANSMGVCNWIITRLTGPLAEIRWQAIQKYSNAELDCDFNWMEAVNGERGIDFNVGIVADKSGRQLLLVDYSSLSIDIDNVVHNTKTQAIEWTSQLAEALAFVNHPKHWSAITGLAASLVNQAKGREKLTMEAVTANGIVNQYLQ